MNISTQISSAILCGVLASTSIVELGDQFSNFLKGSLKEAVVANPNPSAAPALAVNDALPDPAADAAATDEPESNNFTTNANGDLVTTKDIVTRTKCAGGLTLVSITITPVRSGDQTSLN